MIAPAILQCHTAQGDDMLVVSSDKWVLTYQKNPLIKMYILK